MNVRALRWLLGNLCLLLAAALLVPLGVALLYGEPDATRGFAIAAVCAVVPGLLLIATGRGSLLGEDGRPAFFRKEAIVVVVATWAIASLLGALPFSLCGLSSSFTDSLFESTSGFTTTGATIFTPEQIDALPHAVNFWRCFSHWIGGIGIVFVFVVVMPSGGRSLIGSEGAAIAADQARIREGVLGLVKVYVALTVVHAALLVVFGTTAFDAITHAFSTLGTGGFSTHGESVAYFHSPAIEAVIVVFMILAGTSFFVFDLAWRRGWRRAVDMVGSSSEVRAYLLMIAIGCLLLTCLLWFWGGSNGDPGSDLPDYRHWLHAFRDATFSLVSIQTCTGYATANFDQWPDAGRILLMGFAIVGGCSGSTAGGLKVFRFVLVLRSARAAIRSFARPRLVATVMLDGTVTEDARVQEALRYFVLWTAAAGLGALLLSGMGVGPSEALSSVIVCLNNVGPGLGALGPAGGYVWLSAPAKLLLCLYMVLGRLEFYALAALFLPVFWRR